MNSYPIKVSDLTVAQLEKLIGTIIRNNLIAYLQPQEEPPDIVPIEEAMKVTGYARQSIYSMVSKHQIPFIKRDGSKHLLFSRKALLAWINNEEVKK